MPACRPLKEGRVVAESRRLRRKLIATNIRALYGIDADVQFHQRAGHLTVVPSPRD